MKIIQTAAIGVCLLASVAVRAQKSEDTTTRFTPPTIVKDKEPAKGEKKKKEYKSKEWHQGAEGITDTSGASKLRAHKKGVRPPAPPPPPPALPAKPTSPHKD